MEGIGLVTLTPVAPTEYRQRHPVCTGSEAVNDNGIFYAENLDK